MVVETMMLFPSGDHIASSIVPFVSRTISLVLEAFVGERIGTVENILVGVGVGSGAKVNAADSVLVSGVEVVAVSVVVGVFKLHDDMNTLKTLAKSNNDFNGLILSLDV